MNYNNRAQDRIAACFEHDNFFGLTPDAAPFPATLVQRAGLEPPSRETAQHP